MLDGVSVMRRDVPIDVASSVLELVVASGCTSLHIVPVLILSMLSSCHNSPYIGPTSVLSYSMVTYTNRRPVVQDHHSRTVN